MLESLSCEAPLHILLIYMHRGAPVRLCDWLHSCKLYAGLLWVFHRICCHFIVINWFNYSAFPLCCSGCLLFPSAPGIRLLLSISKNTAHRKGTSTLASTGIIAALIVKTAFVKLLCGILTTCGRCACPYNIRVAGVSIGALTLTGQITSWDAGTPFDFQCTVALYALCTLKQRVYMVF